MSDHSFALLLILTLFIVLARCMRLNMADLIGNVCTDLATGNTLTKPVLVRKVNENLRGAMPALLRVARDAGTGNITVYGVNLPNPWSGRTNTRCFLGTGGVAATGGANTGTQAATDYQFSTDMTYVAPSNNNWILLMDEYVEYVAPAGAAVGFTISSSSGARVDFAQQDKSGNGVLTAFTLTIDYGMLTYCDLQVKIGTAVKTITTDYALTNSGGVIVCTFTSAPATGSSNLHFQLIPKKGVRFGLIYAASPTTLKAAGAEIAYLDEIVCKDAVWVLTQTGTVSATDVSIVPRP